MNIGFVGLGKLGLPCALAIDSVKKHNVMGFDVDSNVNEYLIDRKIPYREEGAHELLETHDISFDSPENVIKNSDIIFLPIQTPHDEMYEGVTRIPDSRVDFDYSFLKEGVKEVSNILDDLKKEKIIVINPGVDPVKELNKKSLDKVESLLKIKTPRLITVSRFDKRKNHEKIVMALRNLKQKYPDIVYICIGYGDELENVKDLVKELDLSSQVMFFKDITADLKNALLAKANIFVMPSVIHKKSVEGFGIAYVEAAQYGVPSLGGKDGGASDAISHDKTGLICDGNNLDDIYSSLDSMIENKKYHLFGKNAKEYVSKFQWKKILEEYKKILN